MTAKVGLTGGIGSGKSSVGKLFSDLGVIVIDADEVARKVTATNTTALEQIQHHFGDQCLQLDGSLNRKVLGKLIFDNPVERKWLEQLLHPLIRHESEAQAALVDAPYCILEIPLLVETGRHLDMDAVIVVHCEKAIRLKRLVENRGMDADTVNHVFNSQASDAARLKIADYVVDNNALPAALTKQISQIHLQLDERFQ